VRVADTWGNPVPDVVVAFRSPTSGAGTNPTTTTATTGAGGLASVTPTANSAIGSYDVVASVAGVGSKSFRLTNRYGLSRFSPPYDADDGGTVDVAASTNSILSVQVRDGDGPITGLTAVAWALGCRVTLTEVGTGRSTCMGYDALLGRFAAVVNGESLGWQPGMERRLRVDVWDGSELLGRREVRVMIR